MLVRFSNVILITNLISNICILYLLFIMLTYNSIGFGETLFV